MSETRAPAAPEDSTVEGLVDDDTDLVAEDLDDDTDLVAEDLIEEISIDGMCGVY